MYGKRGAKREAGSWSDKGRDAGKAQLKGIPLGHGETRRRKLSPNSAPTGCGPGPLPQVSFFLPLAYWSWDGSLLTTME